MLADEEITITLDGRRAYMRPSLRAALRLERKFEGFDKLLHALADESVTAMSSVIRESSVDPDDAAGILESLEYLPLRRGIEALKESLIAHVFRLAGHDGTEAPVSDGATRITFAEHHARLYRIATGWLGWEPDVAWDATASEITEAHKGRVEMLRAIFGSGEEPADATPPSNETFNSKILAFTKAMGTRKVSA